MNKLKSSKQFKVQSPVRKGSQIITGTKSLVLPLSVKGTACETSVLPAGNFACVLVSLPDQVVFGLGMRLRVHMRTKLENGVLRNGQQPQSVVNGFC